MGQYTYYCEINRDFVEFKAGVYKIVASGSFARSWFPKLNQTIQFSNRVWKQGPRGGVKIVKDRNWDLSPTGYITQNEEWMKKFFWIKLKAKEIK